MSIQYHKIEEESKKAMLIKTKETFGQPGPSPD